jgi:hypothetical protein
MANTWANTTTNGDPMKKVIIVVLSFAVAVVAALALLRMLPASRSPKGKGLSPAIAEPSRPPAVSASVAGPVGQPVPRAPEVTARKTKPTSAPHAAAIIEPGLQPYPDLATMERDPRLSPAIKLIAGFGETKEYGPRYDATARLGAQLSRPEIDALYAFMDTRFVEQTDLSQLAYNALKNQVLGVLIHQDQMPLDLGGRILAMFRDTGQDIVWRNYCLQFFVEYYETRWPARPGDSRAIEGERLAFRRAFDEALTDTSNGIAGTALLGMQKLASAYPEFQAGDITTYAAAVAADNNASELDRMAALNVAAQMGEEGIRDVARDLARRGDSDALRRSAIAALGYVGNEEDVVFLGSLEKEASTRLHKAIRVSLERLRDRLTGRAESHTT